MTPGLAGPPFPSKATKGAVVAVASLEKPSVPMVVGICEIDVASLQRVQGAKGHAVKGQHWAGDEIWAWNQTGKSGEDAPEQIEGWDAGEASINAGVKDISIDDSEDDSSGGVAVGSTGERKQESEPPNQYVDGEDAEPYGKVDVREKELSTKGMGSRPNHYYPYFLLINVQISMKYSGKLFCMPYIITRAQIRVIRITASAFHFINLWSSPTSSFRTYQSHPPPKQPTCRSKKPAGRVPRNLSKPWTRTRSRSQRTGTVGSVLLLTLTGIILRLKASSRTSYPRRIPQVPTQGAEGVVKPLQPAIRQTIVQSANT